MKDDRLYLSHILECIEKIRQFTSSGKAGFMTQVVIQDAVIRNFEIIGEAAKQLSDEIQERSPSVPWRRICGFRDVLIHNYMGVDMEEVWEIVESHLDPLNDEIKRLLKTIV